MSRFTNLLSTVSLRPARFKARRAYFAVGERAVASYVLLEGHGGRYPSGRALALGDIAARETLMSSIVTEAWPGAESEYAADTLRATGELLQILASTEVANGAHDRQHGPDDWEAGFGWVLDALAESTTSPALRAELLVRLYLAAYPVVGADVAETVSSVRDAYIRLAVANAEEAAGEESLLEPF